MSAQTVNSPNVCPGSEPRTVVRNCVNEALTNNVSSTRAEQKADTLLEDIYLEARKHGNQEAKKLLQDYNKTAYLKEKALQQTDHTGNIL